MKITKKVLMGNVDTIGLNSELIQCNKKFKPYELKIFYKLLQLYINNPDKSEEIITQSVLIKKIIENKKSHLSYVNYGKRLSSMLEFMKIELSSNEIINPIIRFEINKHKTIFVLHPSVYKILNYPSEKKGVVFLPELYSLKSMYSMRAYELCCINGNFKHGRIFRTEDFRKFFGVSSGYEMRDVEKSIIRPMTSDINSVTRFDIKIKAKKTTCYTHNSVHEITFISKETTQKLNSIYRKEINTTTELLSTEWI